MAKNRVAKFKWHPLSEKQKKVLTWWDKEISPVADKDAIIADGSIRSGKTLLMAFSYVVWGMETFDSQVFIMAGKTIGSFKRNVWFWLKIVLHGRGYEISKIPDEKGDAFAITKGDTTNFYYIFGGKDEGSQDLIQGLTAAGAYFDEVALMPESFVDQAIGRCSIDGSKYWFNCNPDGPFHWFKLEWIDKLKEKHAFRIQFTLDDNPSLSEKVKDRYKRMFSGVFYLRMILGQWVMAEGIIYSMFNQSMIISKKKFDKKYKVVKKWIGVDYGQSNATVFLLCGLTACGKLAILDEYYHEGKGAMVQKSPKTYSKDFSKWLKGIIAERWGTRYDAIYIDPSAKGFILQLHEEGIRGIVPANNEVIPGIELLSSLMDAGRFIIVDHCIHTIKEFGAYSWDPKAQARGEDKPIKTHDHAMDAGRYVVNNTRMIWQRLLGADFRYDEMN